MDCGLEFRARPAARLRSLCGIAVAALIAVCAAHGTAWGQSPFSPADPYFPPAARDPWLRGDVAPYSVVDEAGHAPTCGLPYRGDQPQRFNLFGDYLFLSAGGVDVHYALPTAGFVPAGPAASVQPGYHSGFRVGGAMPVDEYSSLVATYWHFESEAEDEVETGFLTPLTDVGGRRDRRRRATTARAEYDIGFRMADGVYRSVLWHNPVRVVNYVVGGRYAQLDQEFAAAYDPFGPTASSEIEFHGFGPRVGLEGERRLQGGFYYYGEGFANLLVGEFDARFEQQGAVPSLAELEDRRIVPLLEMELGLGWQSPSGGFRMRAGYYMSGWFNSVTTPDFLHAVRDRAFYGLDDTLTFNGLTARAEFRF